MMNLRILVAAVAVAVIVGLGIAVGLIQSAEAGTPPLHCGGYKVLLNKDGSAKKVITPPGALVIFPSDVVLGVPGNGDEVLDVGADNGDPHILFGFDGNDTLTGGFNDDVLCGGQGDDILNGSRGNDFLEGGPGNDDLNGNDDDDTLLGGPGDDSHDGGEGGTDMDFCNGSSGQEVVGDSEVGDSCEIDVNIP